MNPKSMAFYFITALDDGDSILNGPFTSWGECNMHREGAYSLPHQLVVRGLQVGLSHCYAKEVDASEERKP